MQLQASHRVAVAVVCAGVNPTLRHLTSLFSPKSRLKKLTIQKQIVNLRCAFCCWSARCRKRRKTLTGGNLYVIFAGRIYTLWQRKRTRKNNRQSNRSQIVTTSMDWSQIATSNSDKMGVRRAPKAFRPPSTPATASSSSPT